MTDQNLPKPSKDSAHVVVVGGGYGGVSVAKALDPFFRVTLIEPKDNFVHTAGVLRSLTDAEWTDKVFFPYSKLLTNGEIITDAARKVTSTQVALSGDHTITPDFLVLATGTSYPYPAKFLEAKAAVAKARLERTRADLAKSGHALLVGAGPTGLELAGELSSSFPNLKITIVEKNTEILAGDQYLPEFRENLLEQLQSRNVEILLGTELKFLPGVDVGVHHPFTVNTTNDEKITADIWFRCFGDSRKSDYIVGDLLEAKRPDGSLKVNEHLQVSGFENVFAVGDITNVPETKRSQAAIEHARVVSQNIKDLAAGRAASASYTPLPQRILLTLGPDGGAAQLSSQGTLRVEGPGLTATLKGGDLLAGPVSRLLGLE